MSVSSWPFEPSGSTWRKRRNCIRYPQPDTLHKGEINLQTRCLPVGAHDIRNAANGLFAAGLHAYAWGARMLSQNGRRMRQDACFALLLQDDSSGHWSLPQ